MAKTNQKSSVANNYAASLLDLANEQNQAENIGQELGALRQIIAGNRTFYLYLSDPGVSKTERAQTIKRIFDNQISPLMHNFLGVLSEHNRMGILEQIADAYDELLADQLGKIEVDLTVPSKLSADQTEEARKRISAALKKEAVVHLHVDESIIGGLVIRVQDKLIDASVKTQLAAMKQQLLSAKAGA